MGVAQWLLAYRKKVASEGGIDLGGEYVASSDKPHSRFAPVEENLALRWTHRTLECCV